MRGQTQEAWLRWLRMLVLLGQLSLLALGVALVAIGLAFGLLVLSERKTISLVAPRGAGNQLEFSSCRYRVRGT